MASRTCIYRRAAARRALLCAMEGAQVVPRVCGANPSLPVGAGAPTRLAKIARILAIFRRFAPRRALTVVLRVCGANSQI